MKKRETPPIDVKNDELMVAEGLRPAVVKPRDPSVWTKTKDEKEFWKSLPRVKYCNWMPPAYVHAAKGKLIVYSKENRTSSHNCMISDIPEILSNFSKIIKYSWNGITYPPNYIIRIR